MSSCEFSAAPSISARPMRAAARTAARCCRRNPGFARLARMFAIRNGFCVTSDNAKDERRICTPPSPKLPSISTGMLKDYHRP